MQLYKRVLLLKKERPQETILEIIAEIVADEKLDHIDVAEQIKKDKSLYDLILQECIEKKLIIDQYKNKSIDLNNIMGD